MLVANTAPWIVGWLNGVSSLIHFGLTNCHGGFGSQSSHVKTLIGGGYPAQYSSRNCNQIAYAPPSAPTPPPCSTATLR